MTLYFLTLDFGLNFNTPKAASNLSINKKAYSN